MIVAAIVGAAVGEAVDWGIWEKRQLALLKKVAQQTHKLDQGEKVFALPVVLDEFYTATERLGYFYSYSLYLANSGLSDSSAEANQNCYAGIKDFFANPTAKSSAWPQTLQSSKCAPMPPVCGSPLANI